MSKTDVMIDEFLDKYFSNEWSKYRSKEITKEKSKEIIKLEWKNSKNFPFTDYSKTLTEQWYDYLSQDVYNDKYFFALLYFCWLKYSRKYINDIYRNPLFSELRQVDNVFDLGNGVGYSTSQLCDIFQYSKVYATNIRNTEQWRFNEYLIDVRKSKNEHYYTLFEDFNELKEIGEITESENLVFASEFFEHLYEPMIYLKQIVDILSPKYFILANSFNTYSVGHYREYKVDDVIVKQEYMTKLFNNGLKLLGYEQLKVGLWNNRPNIWKKT